MTANELADELEKGGGHYMLNIASMLRQQANRIAKLEEELKEEKEHSAILEKDRDAFLTENEALKSHPVKELTDEEIIDIWFEVAETNSIAERQLAFAKAILRKAQEK